MGPCASVGIQLSTPVLASSSTPVGAETRPKVSVLARSLHDALPIFTTRASSSLIVWSAGTVSTGALFTSFTTTVKLLVALKIGRASCRDCILIRLVLGPCASVGVQLSTPVLASSSTPIGAETRPKLSVLAGRSASLAVLVTTSESSSLIVWSAGTVSTGALFTSFTTTVKLLVALRGGAPLSLTFTLIRLVLGPCAGGAVECTTVTL